MADTANDRIQKFDCQGNYVTQWGSRGSGKGQFSAPSGIARDGQGTAYVTDTDWPHYWIWGFDSEGNYLYKLGGYGTGAGQFAYPNGIAVDRRGNVYVADSYNGRIQMFTFEGISWRPGHAAPPATGTGRAVWRWTGKESSILPMATSTACWFPPTPTRAWGRL